LPAWLGAATERLSDISFSLYLSHFPLVMLIGAGLYRQQRMQPDAWGWLTWTGLLLGLLLFGHAIWWLFERHTPRVRGWMAARMRIVSRPAAAPASGHHFAVLDWLRALAALAVFAHHFYQQYASKDDSPAWHALLAHLGTWGVAVFFVLSGFCIHWSSIGRRASRSTFSLKDYASRRFFRIYPGLAICLLISFVLGNAYGSNLLPPSTLGDVLQHLLLISNFSSGHRDGVNNVLWSVVLEVHFYILYGLMPGLFGSLARTLRTTLIAVVIGAAAFAASVTLFPQGDGRVTMQHTALASWWTWCLGAVVAELLAAQRGVVRGDVAKWVGLAVAVGLSIAMCWAPDKWVLQLQRFVLPVAAFAVLWLALQIKAPFGRVKPLMTLGAISYSLYLFHPIAILVGVHVASGWRQSLPITFGLGIAMAYGSYKLIELPGIALGQRLQGRLQIKPA
jgi:peptidoglycan/LPS O-acetylase OafA/YrhL